MPRSPLLLFSIFIVAVTMQQRAQAQSAKDASRYNGQLLVDHYFPPRGAMARDAKAESYFRRAQAYIDGVHDATEGRDWCNPGRIKPHELDADVAWALKGLPASTLKGNAAELIVAYLHKQFPCK